MKEYDLVELIQDRDCYKKKGVQKGMFGAVMSEKCVNGKWQIVFSEFQVNRNMLKFR